MKTIKYLALVMVVFLMGTVFMGIYTLSPTYPTKTSPSTYTSWGNGGITMFAHTFVAATDTCYMVFPVPRPKAGTDTIVAVASMYSAPVGQTGTNDTSNVYWGYQWSDDNSVWSTLTELGQDSTATGVSDTYISRCHIIGSYDGTGIHPFYRLVAIGKVPSGGKLNVIGNKFYVYLIRQYNY